jgi:Tfp pilus assembly protein PilF
MREKEFEFALKALVNAEDASKGKVLSSDQRLDLWIQQSYSYQGLNQLDQAILILSKVINDDTISSLRLKAMYLRAELYERQERPELARKQLEALTKKGGDWAQKAKDKLDKDYGYQ